MMIAKSALMLLFLPLSVLLLLGCSGSQATPSNNLSILKKQPSSSPSGGVDNSGDAQSIPVKDTRPLIVAFGDSLTAGYGTKAGESYPDYLQHDLNAHGYNYHVLNEGISGNTSKDGVLRAQTVAKLHPAVVIVAFGGNDGLRGIPISDTEMNLASIITTFHDAHAKVILGGITLPPNYGHDYIAKFNAMYETLATEYHLPLLPFMLKGVYNVPGDMQSDGIHATAKGNQQVAKNFLPVLLPLLHRGPHPRETAAAQVPAELKP